MLLANFTSYIFDFIVRLKIGGTHLNYFILKQLPVLPPTVFDQKTIWGTKTFKTWIILRVFELIYTSYDLIELAKDLGFNNEPFIWNEERRFQIQCELDAAFFHLYEIDENDINYIMDSFPIVKRNEEAKYHCYRTKEQILSVYKAMQKAMDKNIAWISPLEPFPKIDIN
jgi:hypothetical protein